MLRKNNKKKLGFYKRRKCEICEQRMYYVDYKNIEFLNKFVSGVGAIKPRANTGTCAKHQRKISNAIKRARLMALMPFTKERIRMSKSATNTTMATREKPKNKEETTKVESTKSEK